MVMWKTINLSFTKLEKFMLYSYIIINIIIIIIIIITIVFYLTSAKIHVNHETKKVKVYDWVYLRLIKNKISETTI